MSQLSSKQVKYYFKILCGTNPILIKLRDIFCMAFQQGFGHFHTVIASLNFILLGDLQLLRSVDFCY